MVERLAIERVKKLFGAEYANVQPHSGSQANQAVYFAMLKPGDTILGMSLAHGGHLTHGAAVNLSGKLFRSVGLRPRRRTERIDYDAGARARRASTSPKMIVAGASAYSRVIDWAALPRHRRRGRRAADGGHGALRGPHRRGRLSEPGAASPTSSPAPRTRRCAGRAAGFDPRERRSSRRRSTRAIFPALQGGPLMHVIAAKAVAFHEARHAGVQQVPAARDRQRARDGRGARGARAAHRLGRHRLATCSWSTCAPLAGHRHAMPRRRSAARTSPSTRTRFPTIRRSRWSRAASASAAPR